MMTPTTGLMTLVSLHAVAWAAVMVMVNRLRDRKFAACMSEEGTGAD